MPPPPDFAGQESCATSCGFAYTLNGGATDERLCGCSPSRTKFPFEKKSVSDTLSLAPPSLGFSIVRHACGRVKLFLAAASNERLHHHSRTLSRNISNEHC